MASFQDSPVLDHIMPPQLRARTSRIKPQSYALSSNSSSSQSHLLMSESTAQSTSNTPSIYTINLSLPPRERYVLVATEYAHVLRKMPCLYDEAVQHLRLPTGVFHLLGRLFLRRLHSDEQTEELRGISEASGVPMYLLVAYNVFLDLLMGCTSGGVMVKDPEAETTMMHFRTLDWSMPLLRQAIVQFDFIEGVGGEVIASTIGYVGFVGALTGVRKGLSVSLNFRPYHNARGISGPNIRYYWNTLMVLLGKRPSISTLIRDCLLPRSSAPRRRHRLSKKSLQERRDPSSALIPPYNASDAPNIIATMQTSVAYLIFCTSAETIILEKDFHSARILRSSTFISTTNHDVSLESTVNPHAHQNQAVHTQGRNHSFLNAGMQEVLEESIMRKQCLERKWREWTQEQGRKAKRGQNAAVGMSPEKLIKWLKQYPVCNEVTHFVCVMDPAEGMFRWVRAFEEGEIPFQG